MTRFRSLGQNGPVAGGIHRVKASCTRRVRPSWPCWRHCRAAGAVHFPKVIYDQLPRLRVFTLAVPDGEIRWIYPELLPDDWAEPTALPLTQTIFRE